MSVKITEHEGGVTVEERYLEGMLHREDGPAYIRRGQGYLTLGYYRYDKLHRDDGPALIEYCPDGQIWEAYLRHGRHREDGPGEIRYWADGGKISETWFENDREVRTIDYPDCPPAATASATETASAIETEGALRPNSRRNLTSLICGLLTCHYRK